MHRPALLVGSLRQTVGGAIGTGVLDWIVRNPCLRPLLARAQRA